MKASYPKEEESPTIFRVVEAELVEELYEEDGRKKTRSPQTLPQSGADVFLATEGEIIATLGLGGADVPDGNLQRTATLAGVVEKVEGPWLSFCRQEQLLQGGTPVVEMEVLQGPAVGGQGADVEPDHPEGGLGPHPDERPQRPGAAGEGISGGQGDQRSRQPDIGRIGVGRTRKPVELLQHQPDGSAAVVIGGGQTAEFRRVGEVLAAEGA